MTYNLTNMETAMCLWEAVMEARNKPLTDPLRQQVDSFIEPLGTAEARLAVIDWVPACEAEWDAMDEDEREAALPYDWGHCSDFVARKLADYAPADALHHRL